MSFTPRPITAKDKISHARDVSGLAKWAQSSRFVGFTMLMMGWFTIPVEVLMRKDFGQRWLTRANFIAGLVLLFILAVIEYLFTYVRNWINDFVEYIASTINPFHQTDVLHHNAKDNGMLVIFLFYLGFGCYHLFKIWWRSRTNRAVHSFSDGTSRFEWTTRHIIAPILNFLFSPFLWMYNYNLPEEEVVTPTPKLIENPTAFTNTVIEPAILVSLAWLFDGFMSVWLIVSAVALAINASWKETAKLNKMLDYHDAVLDAKAMKQMREEHQKSEALRKAKQQPKTPVKKPAQASPPKAVQYPDVAVIIDRMHVAKQVN